jgi:hypothetical protein
MALANYSDLQTAIQAFVDRASDAVFVANVPDIIRLAEAKLNRAIPAITTDATLTGVQNSNSISISALSMVDPIALFATNYWPNAETLLTPKMDGTFPVNQYAQKARYWGIDSGANAIVLDRLLDSAYTFRFRYNQKFNLATTSTNWLLTNYPDVYLAACLAWSGGFNEDWVNGGQWKAVLDEAVPEIKNIISRNRKGDATVDPALQAIGRTVRSNQWANYFF